MTGNPKVGTDSLRELAAEHRECGKPKFDGCFAHYPIDHCRADGTPWPCDVHKIRLPALLDLWDAAYRMFPALIDGYQPVYNGRPSCPICANFVDDEETHSPTCEVLKLAEIFGLENPR